MYTVELDRTMTALLLLSLAGSALSVWIAYWVIKEAIRNGIKQSGLVEALRDSNRRQAPTLERETMPMGDIRPD